MLSMLAPDFDSCLSSLLITVNFTLKLSRLTVPTRLKQPAEKVMAPGVEQELS